MTCAFDFGISNISLNIFGPSIPVNVDTSASLVICANNIGIGIAAFGLVIVSISIENDCSSSHSLTVTDSSTFIHLNQVLLYQYHFLYYPHLSIHFVQLKNCH